MVIGIPREIMHDEGRVSATPETVKKMKADGFEVLVEKNAGAGAFFADEEYAAAGRVTGIVDGRTADKSEIGLLMTMHTGGEN